MSTIGILAKRVGINRHAEDCDPSEIAVDTRKQVAKVFHTDDAAFLLNDISAIPDQSIWNHNLGYIPICLVYAEGIGSGGPMAGTRFPVVSSPGDVTPFTFWVTTTDLMIGQSTVSPDTVGIFHLKFYIYWDEAKL